MSDAAAHPWLGALFGDPEIARILSPEAELKRMLEIEAAWSRTIAPEDHGPRIAKAIIDAPIAPADLAQGTARDGVPVPALVKHLKTHVAAPDHRWLHSGLTSQDVIDTALMLALREILPLLSSRLDTVRAALAVLAQRDGARALMAVTRMQPALPMTVTDRVGGWQRPLDDLSRQLTDMADRCLRLQWGGPVGVRDTRLPADTGPRFADTLGLKDPGAAWHTDRGVLADLSGILSRVTGATGKIGQDVALLAQMGPAALVLTGGGESSAMPHKKNPVLAELLVTLARRNAGDLSLMHHALLHEQDRSGAAWMLEWLVLPQMLETTGRSLRTATDLILRINRMGEAG